MPLSQRSAQLCSRRCGKADQPDPVRRAAATQSAINPGAHPGSVTASRRKIASPASRPPATTTTNDLEFIRGMNPYGEQPVMFPNLSVDDDEEYKDLAEVGLQGRRGRRVAPQELRRRCQGGERRHDDVAQKQECFYWDFRFPDDPTPDGAGNVPKGGPMRNLQITKAIRIPFVYRQATSGQLLLGHLLIGYEGAGGM